MKQVKVNTDSIRHCHREASSRLENLRSVLGSMHKSVDELNETWEGANHNQFVEEFENLYGNMEQVCNTLDSYLTSVNESAQLYETCDSEIASLVSF